MSNWKRYSNIIELFVTYTKSFKCLFGCLPLPRYFFNLDYLNSGTTVNGIFVFSFTKKLSYKFSSSIPLQYFNKRV